jgi:hypothetical protein
LNLEGSEEVGQAGGDEGGPREVELLDRRQDHTADHLRVPCEEDDACVSYEVEDTCSLPDAKTTPTITCVCALCVCVCVCVLRVYFVCVCVCIRQDHTANYLPESAKKSRLGGVNCLVMEVEVEIQHTSNYIWLMLWGSREIARAHVLAA